jgi:small subunit ribosomal protein S17
MSERRMRKERQGIVISNRMNKTVVVAIERMVAHSKYKKYLRVRSKLKAHDEGNQCQIGDRVAVTETRPLSRDKRWRVSRVLERTAATAAGQPPESAAKN